MKLFTTICIIFIAIVLSINASRVLKEYRLSKSEDFVTVTIQKLPDCSVGYRNKFICISYNGTTHILRTKCKYVAGLVKGQQLEMLHEPDTEIFLFKEENVTTELIAFTLLVFILIVCLITGLKPLIPERKVGTTPVSRNGSK